MPPEVDIDFFVEGVPCEGIVGVATGVLVAELDNPEVGFLLTAWLTEEVLTDFVEADIATCLTVTLLLFAASLEVLADVDGLGAFATGDDFAVVFVVVDVLAAADFVAVVDVLDDGALLAVAAFFLAGALRRSGTSSSSSSSLSLSLTSSSLLDSTRFRLVLIFVPLVVALVLGIAFAGKSNCPRSSVLIFLLMKASMVFVTFVLARMST